MAGNEGLPHSKKIHVIKHLTNIKIQSISVSKRTSSHNLQLTNTEKKPPPKRGDFFDPTWRIRQVNNFPHKKTLRSPKKAQGVSRGDAAQASPLGFSYHLSKMYLYLFMTRNPKSCHSSRQSQLIHMILLNTLLLSHLLLSSFFRFLRTADINLLRALCS